MLKVNDSVEVLTSYSDFFGRTGKIIKVSDQSMHYCVQIDNSPVWFSTNEVKLLLPHSVKAIDLTRHHLWHWVTLTDYAGNEVNGVLHRIELDGDSRTRVVLRVMIKGLTETGETYWSTFGNERYVNQDSDVQIGELLPENERFRTQQSNDRPADEKPWYHERLKVK